MRKLKKLVAVLMLVFVVGIAAPQALAGDVGFPPVDIHQPGKAGDVQTPTKAGDIQNPPFAAVVNALAMILGNSWNL